MRKGRGFRLKGFSTGNGKTSKPMMTGRQFGSRFDSPLSYSPDGVKPNPPKSNYVDEEAQNRADDIAHGDGLSTPRPEVTEQVDAGMPEVTPYSGDMTLSSRYGDKTWADLDEQTRGILEERRSKPKYNTAADSSHPDSYWDPHAPYLTESELKAGGNYYKYNPNSEFAMNLKTAADRTAYNTSASRFARRGESWKTTGHASYTIFNPQTGKRETEEIWDPNFKPHSEEKVSLDKKEVKSVSPTSTSTTTKKPTRSTKTKTDSGDKAEYKNYTERTGKQTERGTGKTYEDVWATASDEYKAKYGGDKKKAIQAMKDWNKEQDEKKKNKNKKKK